MKSASAPHDRLMNHVVKQASGCWEFTGALSPQGYGRLLDVRSGRRISRLAHRVSWELHKGPILIGLHVLHHCDNRKCVNPDHLFLGTNADNVRDRTVKGRSNRPYGESNGRAVLTPEDAYQIRTAAMMGTTRAALAAMFGVSKSQVTRIVNMKAWGSIPH